MWAVKEAVLKSFGIGLRVDLREIEVTYITSEGKAEVVLHNMDNNGQLDLQLDNALTVWLDQKDDYVIARSVRTPN